MKTSTKDIYAKKAIEQIPRLLSRLDKNPYSPTYGSFDWMYWSEKLHDSPVGRFQENCLVLSLIYKYEFPQAEAYYQNPKILEWCKAAMIYWGKMQHTDGSVDENYYNERQFGATAFTLYAIAKSFLILGDNIEGKDRTLICQSIRRAANFISDNDETHLLTNHQTMAVIALHLAGKVLQEDFNDKIQPKLSRIFSGRSDDGWLNEYSGSDLGYLTISIANLSEFNRDEKNPEIKALLKHAIEYISYFTTPDGTFGGSLGVRNTNHFWPSGFEREAQECEVSCAISRWAREMISDNSLMIPARDDWYLGCLIYDYLLAYLNGRDVTEGGPLPFQRSNFVKYFRDSKTVVEKCENIYAIVNGFKGGIFKAWDCNSKKLIKSDDGLIGLLGTGDTVSTNRPDSQMQVQFDKEKRTIMVRGQFAFVSFEYPSFIKYTMFKTFNLVFGFNVKVTNFIKDILIKKVITKDKVCPIYFERKINLSTLEVGDHIRLEGNIKFKSLSAMDELVLIGFGYAKYFCESQLNTRMVILDEKEVQKLNEQKEIIFRH